MHAPMRLQLAVDPCLLDIQTELLQYQILDYLDIVDTIFLHLRQAICSNPNSTRTRSTCTCPNFFFSIFFCFLKEQRIQLAQYMGNDVDPKIIISYSRVDKE